MPELPEVETVRRTLKTKIINKKIIAVEIFYPNIIVEPSVEEFKKNLIFQTIMDIKRKGKWLMFELTDYYLLSHLRMEGKYNLKSINDKIEKHEHVNFIFDDNTCLRYKDTRKFGKMYLYSKDEVLNKKPLNELGLEPWDDNLNINYLKNKYTNKRLPIKTILLDQGIITGIGNIYADEVLFGAKINPLKLGINITLEECQRIVSSAKRIIQEAIKYGGTTIKSYTSSLGVTGRFQEKLMVHKRENEKCKLCGTIIKRIVVGGRSTYYCEKCQKDS